VDTDTAGHIFVGSFQVSVIARRSSRFLSSNNFRLDIFMSPRELLHGQLTSRNSIKIVNEKVTWRIGGGYFYYFGSSL